MGSRCQEATYRQDSPTRTQIPGVFTIRQATPAQIHCYPTGGRNRPQPQSRPLKIFEFQLSEGS